MGKIQEMSMDEIIEKIGANLVDIDFHLVFHNNQEVLDRLTRLMKRLDNTEGLSENGRIAKIEDFLEKMNSLLIRNV